MTIEEFFANNEKFHPILIFKGGGYDGCFWEWNAIQFVSPIPDNWERCISGWKGREVLRNLKAAFIEVVNLYGNHDEDYYFIYDMEEWKKAWDTFNSGVMRDFGRAFDLPGYCHACDSEVSADELFADGYRGNGGVGIEIDEVFCLDCLRERHIEFCTEEWKRASVRERLEAIKEYNKHSFDRISILAARKDTWPTTIEYNEPMDEECFYSMEMY